MLRSITSSIPIAQMHDRYELHIYLPLIIFQRAFSPSRKVVRLGVLTSPSAEPFLPGSRKLPRLGGRAGTLVTGNTSFSCFFCSCFAIAYTIPAANPIITAVTEKNVTGASKKIIPEMATGSLFNAPAILGD